MEILPLISFLTGVISILSPCILPIIPIVVAVAFKSKTEIMSFTLGLLSIFIAVIFLTGFFTSLVYAYVPYVRILSAVVLLVIGILMLSNRFLGFASLLPKTSGKTAGSFALGLLTSLSWAPCYGAYLMSLIALLVGSGDPVYASLNIVLYCIGFGLTLLVLGYLISKIDLERIASKTRYLPKAFALLVIAGAVYLLWESLKVFI